MLEVRVRKKLILLEDIFHEGGPVSAVPQRRGAALAVIHNPFAGAYVENIAEFMEDLKPFGLSMAQSLVAALGGDPRVVEGYGKGAIVGTAGELEHGALWHVPGGYAMRDLLGGAKAIVPSTKKVGAPGTRLDIPITHVNASYVRSHFDAMEVGINDAPGADEILLALVMTTGPRIHARVGGLKATEIKGEDGLRWKQRFARSRYFSKRHSAKWAARSILRCAVPPLPPSSRIRMRGDTSKICRN